MHQQTTKCVTFSSLLLLIASLPLACSSEATQAELNANNENGPANTKDTISASGGSNNQDAENSETQEDNNTPADHNELALELDESSKALCYVNGVVESSNQGFSGEGYLNSQNEIGAAIEWSFSTLTGGERTFSWRFANGGESRPARLLLNDIVIAENLDFASSGGWDVWTDFEQQFTLSDGENRLRLEATTAGGLANIDFVNVSGEAEALECAASAELPLTIWLAGDSTVANGPTPCPTGWGAYFDTQFNDLVSVNNLAVGGRSVRTWLYDVTDSMGSDGECVMNSNAQGKPIEQQRWIDTKASIKSGDYLFIQFGINDGSPTCPRHVGANALEQEYEMMATAARERGAHPVFVTPVSAIRCSGNVAVASRGFVSEVKELGASLQVPVVDLHQLSIDRFNQLNFCPAAAGGVSASTTGAVGDYFCDDHTHFSDSGATDIATLVADALSNVAPGLAAYRQ